jgi:hypothetical protein
MSCEVSAFAKIEPGTKITAHGQPSEIVLYVGSDEALVLVFDQDSLEEFIAAGEEALQQCRTKTPEAAL